MAHLGGGLTEVTDHPGRCSRRIPTYSGADLDRYPATGRGSIGGHVRRLGYCVQASEADLPGDALTTSIDGRKRHARHKAEAL